ncbi:MAG: glycosyl hydrolase [Planctomycetota bacterium]
MPTLLPLLLLSSLAVALFPREDDPPAEDSASPTKLVPETFAGLAWRGLGPALMSGRISDIAVDPTDPATWYVTAASGGVWKTANAGTTWTPVFDDQGSYSIGCVSLDPRNPLVVWIGTGENNSQRSVGYGDGVYKSLDGGRSWRNVGLKDSAHVGKILIDPRDSATVYVAAQGPLWSPGGDRGLYRTTNGGETWECVLAISENTGVTDVVLDPRDPDVIWAASWQRRRHVAILLGGGPESSIRKSTDGGVTWREVRQGLPEHDLGRIGLAVSPQDPDILYAAVESIEGESGFFRSEDGGESWEKRSDYYSTSGQYYGEIFADPHRFDRVFAMDTVLHVTDDGGRTFRPIEPGSKHVDNHAMWFDPRDPDHMLVGCDGGLYETWDDCRTHRFVANLPLTQFYRVEVDQARPFYRIYGGTQDNNTQGGPSRTDNRHGIRNSDWFVTLGGDGFQTRVDPEDPDVVYSQYQHAGLVRYDRESGERVEIQPQPEPGEPPIRWHWNSPLILSPHSHTRLYFAGERVFRSDDRGDTWVPISGDLSRGLDRNRIEIMARTWSVDAVNRNGSSSPYGTIVSLAESPLVEGLLYAGTDDGLVQVTADGGASWRAVEALPGVPARAFSTDLVASAHAPDTVFALFENHKEGDFRPYVLRSDDRGRTWTSIAGDLPANGPALCLVQDHVRSDLLFVSTEFGVHFALDGGGKWIRLSGGIPTIAVPDMEIQRREDDLVLATFGRGFYVLDDYSPLRQVGPAALEEEAVLFPVKKAWWYVPASPLGGRDRAEQGDGFFTAPNPPFGAVFTYYLRDGLKSRRDERREAEKKAREEGRPIAYPSWDELRREDREEEPAILLIVSDLAGGSIRTLSGPAAAGFHRVAWDLRYPAFQPVNEGEEPPGGEAAGPLAIPGSYRVQLARRVDGVVTPIGAPQMFETVPLREVPLSAADRAALLGFQLELGRLQRAVLGAGGVIDDTLAELASVGRALAATPGTDSSLGERAHELRARLLDLQTALAGDRTIARRNEPTPPSIQERIGRAVEAFETTSAPTTTQRRAYEIAATEFAGLLAALTRLVDEDLARLEADLERAGAPWTRGRGVPRWQR